MRRALLSTKLRMTRVTEGEGFDELTAEQWLSVSPWLQVCFRGGDSVKDKSDSIRFLVLWQSWMVPSAPWLRLCQCLSVCDVDVPWSF